MSTENKKFTSLNKKKKGIHEMHERDTRINSKHHILLLEESEKQMLFQYLRILSASNASESSLFNVQFPVKKMT